VLYVSADEHIARQVIEAFEKESGIRVLMVGDTEAKKTTGLANRLVTEKESPQADVFWSSEVFMTIELAEQGILAPFDSEIVRDWPKAVCDEQKRWFGFASRARVIVYSPERVPPDAVPRTWMDLTQSRFRGRVVMADPRFGTTGGHLAAMLAYWNREFMRGYYEAFLEGLAENEIRLLPSGNAGVVEAVARGEADVGMTDTDDVWAAKQRGLNVELVYARHHADESEKGGGTLLIPNTVALIRNGPNPENAKRLMSYLLSEKVERMLAESVSHNVPVRAGIAKEFSQYAVVDPLQIDLDFVAKARSVAIEKAMRILTSERSETKSTIDQPREKATPPEPYHDAQ
jgi:iron(III) transport system substrate-binding protein